MATTTPWILLGTVLFPLAFPRGQVTGCNDDRAAPGTLPVDEIRAWLSEEGVHDSFVPERPLGITADLAEHIPADIR